MYRNFNFFMLKNDFLMIFYDFYDIFNAFYDFKPFKSLKNVKIHKDSENLMYFNV